MRNVIMASLFTSFFVGAVCAAEIATPVPFSYGGCTGGTKNYEIYRCICRADLKNPAGGVTSVPLQVNGTSTFIFVQDNSKDGTACEGRLASDPCNPAVLNGAVIAGKWTCALGTTNGSGFDVK